MACSSMHKRDREDLGKDIPKQAGFACTTSLEAGPRDSGNKQKEDINDTTSY